MDNANSQPQIQTPTVPVDFEAKAGTSKSDFARAILQLLSGAKIIGITPDAPSPYDLAALTASVEDLQQEMDKVNRPIRRITMQGVNNGQIIVPFQDIGTKNYSVSVAYVTPSGTNFDPIQWSIVENSKQTSQVTIRCDGRSATFPIEVTIVGMDNV
jgi:hypothetical protein